MWKKNQKTLFITGVFTLLPMLIGFLLWDQLPDPMATHFGADGQADGYSGKAFAVIGFPVLLWTIQWIVTFAIRRDPKRNNINPQVFHVILWIIPVISVVTNALVYAVNLGKPVDVSFVLFLLVGIVFIVTGYYLPKSRRNYTVGIRTPWTLENDEVWNQTHRLGGYLFLGLGVFGIAMAFVRWIPIEVFVLAVIAVGCLLVVYSYLLYKREKA